MKALLVCCVLLVHARARAEALPAELNWEQLARLVRETAPSILVARAEARAVAAEVPVAAQLPNPELSYLGYARTRGNSAAINGTQHQAQLEQPILLFGQRAARTSSAERRVDVATAQVGLVQLEALRVARHNFVSLLANRASADAVAAAEVRLRAALHVVKTRAAAGAQSAYDVLRVELEHAQLSVRLQQAHVAERSAAATLASELGKHGWLPRALGRLEPRATQRASWEQLEAHHPLARALAQSLRSESAAIELAKAERRPIPALTAGGYWTTDGDSSSLVFGVSLPLPILNTGRAQIETAGARYESAEIARDQLLAQARARYEGALAVLAEAQRSYELYKHSAVERLPQLRDMAEAAYKAGAANVLVLVDANRSATEIELGLVEVGEALLHAEADVLAAAAAL